MLLDHGGNLVLVEASEGEHTDLLGDVRPVSGNVCSLELATEGISHINHSLGDINELTQPLLSHFGVVQDQAGNAGSVLGRGRVVGSDDNLHLGEYFDGGIFVIAKNVEGTGSLTIETHGLGERLSNNHLETLVNKVAEAPGIIVEVAGSKALVGSVEEGVELVLFADFGDLFPFFSGGVNTGGVVGTSVEKDCRASRDLGEILKHTLDIKTLGRWLEESVVSNFDTSGAEHSFMVAPGRVTDIEGSGSEFSEEFSNNTESTSSGKGLESGDKSVGNVGGVESELDTTGTLVEILETILSRVLLVKICVYNLVLGLLDDWENVGLAVVITVSSDTQIALVGVLIIVESNSEAENSIGGCHRDVRKLVVKNAEFLHGRV